MKLSVVVPFYNVELYIRDCLASIARQTLSDLEVILVDDGSPDGSRAIAEEYAEADSRFRIVTQENQGLGPARNTGMRLATGDYLTFVDSDDIIPRQAFAQMVRRLDNQGSDFAAGNAQRFNIHGSRDSWLHKEPFAEDRRRTSVREFPLLANDRMVWNKVYRRSFWEAGGYEFPPIMYEDYPVTLRAHLDASAVEVVSTPVYMWRERDAGETSITQRVHEARNIRDRVTSALMVFEAMEGATPEVRQVVQRHLLTTDFGAIARAVALAIDTPPLPEVVADARRFAEAFDPELLRGRSPLDRVLHQLMMRGEPEGIRQLVAVRDEVLPPAAHERPSRWRKRRQVTLPGADLSMVDPDWRTLQPHELDFDGRALAARWDPQESHVLRIDVEAWINFAGELAGGRPTAWLRSRRGYGDLPVTVLPGHRTRGNRAFVTVEVDCRALVDRSGTAEETHPWTLWLRIGKDDLTREGPVRHISPGSATAAMPWRADEWTWVQSGQHRTRFVVDVLRRNPVVDSVSTHLTGEVTLRGRSLRELPRGVQVRAVMDRQPDSATLYPVRVEGDGHAWSAHLQLAPLAGEDSREPLVDQVREWRLDLVDRRHEETLTINPDLADTRVLVGDQEVQLVSNRFHAARLDVVNPQFAIEELVRDSGSKVRLRGRWLDTSGAGDDIVLRWYRDPDVPEEIHPAVDRVGDSVEFDLDLARISSTTRDLLRDGPSAPAFWDASVWHGDQHVTVHLMPSLVRRLPAPYVDEHGSVLLTTHRRNALRVLVEPTD